MDKTYEPKDVETRHYHEWETRGYFHAEPTPGKPKYSITIPPPNITGSLHMGHALNHTVQDTLGRWHKMRGFTTLILPGTDHASISTQMVVEKQIAKEGLTRHDLGRERFLERVWEWKQEYGARIISQLKALGCAYDWQRERFTMDTDYSAAVKEAFVRFYDQGYIYRGNRMINWCPRCQTVISDIEVEEEEQNGHLWHIKYPFADGSGFVTVATTRPETMLGDTAVAVNPNDPRYQGLIGKMIALPLTEREIPLIADDYASLEFGTGAVKITPAHDPNDYEVGQRHDLPMITVIGFDAKMTPDAGDRYSSLDRYEARNLVVTDLEELDLLDKIEDYTHNVPVCERCHTTIEPLLSDQWFMTMKGNPMVARAAEIVEQDEIQFVPERYKRIYLEWLAGIRDWPLSRQLWWGHRLPIYYKTDGTHVAARSWDEAVQRAGTSELTQDEDVLDTWFSSGLWPFATLGWPQKTADLEYFYPTDVLTTDRGIIYLWVARMVMNGLEFMDEKPFKDVYIHATVLDKKGRKMSKTLGNGIDPVELINKYGTDALRFSLLRLASKGQDIRFSEDRVPEARNFANKLWNAARFVLMNLGEDYHSDAVSSTPTLPERWIMSRLQHASQRVSAAFGTYDFDDACNALYEFIWNEFCDWFVELCKPALQSTDVKVKHSAQETLRSVLETTLRLLHPIMPFITEEIWLALPHQGESICLTEFPEVNVDFMDTDSEAGMTLLIDSVTALRTLRAEYTPGGQENEVARAAILARRFTVSIMPENDWAAAALRDQQTALQTLARLGDVQIASLGTESVTGTKSITVGVPGAVFAIPASELLEGVDPVKEIGRLGQEVAKLDKELGGIQGRLNNPSFVERAAPEAVEKARQDADALSQRREKLESRRQLLQELAASPAA